MKLEVTPSGEGPIFEVEVIKVMRGVNDYLIGGKIYRAFQYDCYGRPGDYEKEYAETLSFRGYLIGRGKNPTLECYIKVKY